MLTRPNEARDSTTIANDAANLEKELMATPVHTQSASELVKTGSTYVESGKNADAIIAFELALEQLKISASLVNTNEAAIIETKCYTGLAVANRELGSNDLTNFLKAEAACEKINHDDPEYLTTAYNIARNLGIGYLKLNDCTNAALTFKKAVDFAQTMNNAALLAPATSYYGLSLVKSGDTENGLQQLDVAMSRYPVEGRETSLDFSSHFCHRGIAFQYIGRHAVAAENFAESLKIREALTSSMIGTVYRHSRLGDCHFGLAQCNFKLGNYPEARKWLAEAFENFTALKNVGKLVEITQMQREILTATSASQLGNRGLLSRSPSPAPAAAAAEEPAVKVSMTNRPQ